MAAVRKCRQHQIVECDHCKRYREFDGDGVVWVYAPNRQFGYDSDSGQYGYTSDSSDSGGGGDSGD